ncbi:acyltransferase [Lampropedia puyangensis]|uniref:Acyltransferase n=1 Tax=Lampropedia puyangensis TaxID=1330072 RepID=A0A4S8F8U8_9BURK|nr:acyltransferase [Lampropedia puyangensis]THU03659.1 acyltransferase [Lampropedia puyangensis]
MIKESFRIPHHNNFDFLRIVAAFTVLYSHHFSLTGQMEPSFIGLHSLGGLAVLVFFVISGYLVSMSWYNDPNVVRFAWRRVLRIWPALTVVVVFVAYGLGPVVSSLPVAEYLTHRATFDYLNTLLMKVHYVLPGVFENNPYARGVNGSLWTIPLEVRCYVYLGIAGIFGLLRKRSIFFVLILAYMVWFVSRSSADLYGRVDYGRELSAFFLAGSCLFLLKKYWERNPVAWFAVSTCTAGVLWFFGWRYLACWVLLPLLVIWFGTRSFPLINRIGRWGDPSYGIYLFAFPVQQTVIFYLWPEWGFWSSMALASVITVVLAYASWHFIEKQALRFKPAKDASLITSLAKVRSFSGRGIQWDGWVLWPAVCCVVGLRRIAQGFDGPVSYDAVHTYLPAARSFLENGWSFLLTEESYRVVPLAYLWPALWQAEPTLIRLAHCGVWIACVFLLWSTARKLGGVVAGMLATLLLTSHRDLLQYFPTELTEPLFLFGIFAWFFGLARIWIDGAQSRWVVAWTGLALTVTLLSRPVLQLMAPLALLLCLLLLLIQRNKNNRYIDSTALAVTSWSLLIGLMIPIMLVLKNGLTFGLWGLGTGSGVGLYLGTHPLFQGAEPVYLGFDFDVGMIGVGVAGAAAGDQLTLVSDPIVRAAGVWHITHMVEPVQFFLRKTWWLLAHHPFAVDALGSALRKVRLFELCTLLTALALMAWYQWRRTPALENNPLLEANRFKRGLFFFLLLVGFIGMFVQLLPILYNNRYSSAILDPWLILLTAYAFSYLARPLRFVVNRQEFGIRAERGQALVSALAVVLLPVIVAIVLFNQARRFDMVYIDNPSVTDEIVALPTISTHGLEPHAENTWESTAVPAMVGIEVDSDDLAALKNRSPFNALWSFSYTLKLPAGKRCAAEIAWQKSNGEIVLPSYRLPLVASNTRQTAYIHANGALRPHEPGRLRVVMHCPYKTQLQWHGAQLLESTHAQFVAAELKRLREAP